MRALALVLLVPALVVAQAPLRLGDPAFRVGTAFREVLLSPEGSYFAAITADGDVHFLDAITGRLQWTWHGFFRDHFHSFDARGYLSVSEQTGWVRLLDPAQRRVVRAVYLPLAKDGCNRVWGGSRVVERCEDHNHVLSLVDLVTGQELPERNWRVSPDRLCYDIVHRPQMAREPEGLPVDGNHWLRIRDLDARQDRWVALPEDYDWSSFTWYRQDVNPRTALLARPDKVLFVDLHTGQKRSLIPQQWAGASYYGHVLSPDGKFFATRCNMPGGHVLVREWDAASGRLRGSWHIPGWDLAGPQYTADGRLLCWTSTGTRLRVVDVRAVCWSEALEHQTPLRDVRFSEDGSALESLDQEGRVCQWDVATGRLVSNELVPTWGESKWGARFAERSVEGFGLSTRMVILERGQDDDAGHIRANRDGGFLKIERPWPGAMGGGLGGFTRMGECRTLWSPEGRRWYFEAEKLGPVLLDRWSNDPALRLPDVLRRFWSENLIGPTEAVLAPDRDRLILAGEDSSRDHPGIRVAVIEPSTRILLRCWQPLDRTPKTRLVFSTDATQLAISTSGELVVYEAETGLPRHHLRSPAAPLTFSPDGRNLLVFVAASERTEGEAQLIELATGSIRCRWPVRTPAAPPRFSPDGKRIAYPQQDATILLLPTDLAAQLLDPTTLWRDLGSRDAAVANVAVQALAARPNARKEIAARRLSRAGEADTVDPVGLLPDLDADDPVLREAAQRRLRSVPTAAIEALQASLLNPSPEVRRALRDRLEVADEVPELTTDQLRRLRVAEVLDRLSKQ
jgi:WD40 repeat protein